LPAAVADNKAGILVLDRPGAAGSGVWALFGARSVASSDFGSFRELVVIVGNPEHVRLSRALFHYSGNGTHFLTPLSPMIWVISQQARHGWRLFIGHWMCVEFKIAPQ
jgi:hypothetical protein